jgi:multidrug efflux pump subunit AcrB
VYKFFKLNAPRLLKRDLCLSRKNRPHFFLPKRASESSVMASQANIQARIAEVWGVRQRLMARKSANPASEAERTANDELNADITRLDELRASLQALVAAMPPPPAAVPETDLTDYVSIQAYIDRRKAEDPELKFKQIQAAIAAMVQRAKSADPNLPIQIIPATIAEELWYY